MQGKVVVITGASRGIGAAAARVFAAAGAQVALLARSADAVAGLAQEIGPQAMALGCDV
ncbi:MAG: SDR family NAD(P)-dependent oxidoreductase, partial [Rhodobacteraceae bacterium]|nr:SDR family NAD(P)-dependent oxidoreductase [Paracoccaceae bacterium]